MIGIVTVLDRGLGHLYRACGGLAALALVILAILILASIVTRLFGTFIPGLNAYSGYTLAAAGFLALSYTFVEGGHIRVAILRTRLRGAARLAIEIWCLAVGAFFACYLAWYLVDLTRVSWKLREKSEGIDATLLWIPQSVTAIGAVVMAIAVVHALIKLIVTRDTSRVGAAADAGAIE